MLTDDEKEYIEKLTAEATIAYSTALQMTHDSNLATTITCIMLSSLTNAEKADARVREERANSSIWSFLSRMAVPDNDDSEEEDDGE